MLQVKTADLAQAQAAEGYVLAAVGEDCAEAVRGCARDMGWADPVIREAGPVSALAFIKSAQAPGVLVLDVDASADPAADVARLVSACGAGTCLVAVGSLNDVRLYRRVREAGARDYLVKPLTSEGLKEGLSEALNQRTESRGVEAKAKTIAMIGARGGVGTTTLAISAGWSIAAQHQKVVLLDLDLHFGSAALSLDLEPGRGLRELLTHPDRIDRLLIDAAANDAGDRLRILSAEEPLEDHLDFTPEGLSVIVHDLSLSSNVLIVDVPRVLNTLSRSMLATADVVTIVTDLSLAAMRDTQRLVAMLRGLRGDMTPVIVANRVGGVGGEVGVPEFEKAVGLKISHMVPFDKQAAIAAAETAKPLIEAAKAPKTVQALQQLAAGFSGAGTAAPKAAPSFLQRVLGK